METESPSSGRQIKFTVSSKLNHDQFNNVPPLGSECPLFAEFIIDIYQCKQPDVKSRWMSTEIFVYAYYVSYLTIQYYYRDSEQPYLKLRDLGPVCTSLGECCIESLLCLGMSVPVRGISV